MAAIVIFGATGDLAVIAIPVAAVAIDVGEAIRAVADAVQSDLTKTKAAVDSAKQTGELTKTLVGDVHDTVSKTKTVAGNQANAAEEYSDFCGVH